MQGFVTKDQIPQLLHTYKVAQQLQGVEPTDSNVAALVRSWRLQIYQIYRYNFENPESPWYLQQKAFDSADLGG